MTGCGSGFVWSGNPLHGNDRNRSLPLRMLSRLLDVDATFVSLQRESEARRPGAALRERTDIVDLTADLTDFSETAALACCLDLVITVDTSVAHLAGALGSPDLDPAALRAGLSLAARSRRQPLVSDGAAVPAGRDPRLRKRAGSGAKRTRSVDLGQTGNALMNRRERRTAAARGPQTKPPSPGPNTPAACYEAGLRHMRAGQYLDAQICCQQALAIDPGHAETLHLMGLLSLQSEQYDHAVEWISRALRQDPKAEYLYSLGTALRQQGRLEDALKAFDKAVQLKPDKAELWIGLGTRSGRPEAPGRCVAEFPACAQAQSPPLGRRTGMRRRPLRAGAGGGGASLFHAVHGVAAEPRRQR